jgi:hypothetical protein
MANSGQVDVRGRRVSRGCSSGIKFRRQRKRAEQGRQILFFWNTLSSEDWMHDTDWKVPLLLSEVFIIMIYIPISFVYH